MQARTCRTGRPSHYPVSYYVCLALSIIYLCVLLCHYVCLSGSVYQYICLSCSVSMFVCLALSVNMFVLFSLSVCLFVLMTLCMSGSVSVLAWLCLSLCHLALSVDTSVLSVGLSSSVCPCVFCSVCRYICLIGSIGRSV